MLAGAGGYLVLLAAFDYVTILVATGVFILSKTVLRPALLALISWRADVGQGTAVGLGNTLLSLGRVGGSLWAGFIFDVRLTLPYLSGAAIVAFGFVVCLIWISPRRRLASQARPGLSSLPRTFSPSNACLTIIKRFAPYTLFSGTR
jgi:DHA1 family multidrug resistance protein-like MFS transporter